MASPQRKVVRVLFDETHSESWSSSRATAQLMQPDNPGNSSYAEAAEALEQRDFVVQRHCDGCLDQSVLEKIDLLVVVHPCDPKWERTTGGSAVFASTEIEAILAFVTDGGGLIVVGEYEHDKYGNNLNDLLAPIGIRIDNTTVSDAKHCLHDTSTWITPDLTAGTGHPLEHAVRSACFYRSGSCTVWGDGSEVIKATTTARPSAATLLAAAAHGRGRVVVVADSDLFGDDHIDHFDHRQLWLNIAYWSSAEAFGRLMPDNARPCGLPEPLWLKLKDTVEALRSLQQPDGSVQPANHSRTHVLVSQLVSDIEAAAPYFPRVESYLQAVARDLQQWQREDFGKPDFGVSLATFHPEQLREDGIEHLAVFPMYTPNASQDVRFEAIIFRVPWPSWLADLEKTRFRNDKFVPGHLVRYTSGYDTECAVLFPETISLRSGGSNNFGVIFCDREAKRYRRYVSLAAELLRLELFPELDCFLRSSELVGDVFALWDLIHDTSHSHGELPFDPFMIRQRMPFWMYGLEELRVDLASFAEGLALSTEFPFARYVCYAVLFDRIFRFATTGARLRNYDALGGQLLFSVLHKDGILVWSDNQLTIRWDQLDAAVMSLKTRLRNLYAGGIRTTRMAYWLDAHDTITEYVKPNLASKWKKDSRVIDDERNPRAWVDLVNDDEFPLGSFHVQLRKRLETALARNSGGSPVSV